MQLPRNHRVGRITELDFPNAFQVSTEGEDSCIPDLALRKASTDRKTGWFRKVITAAFAATAVFGTSLQANGGTNTACPVPIADSPAPITEIPVPAAATEVVLENGITIHNSGSEAVEAFRSLVSEYPNLWTDTGFAHLPEKDWMQIPLKADWEARIPGKARVYPLGGKDRALVDETFDALHESGKLSWTKGSTPFSYPVFCVWKTINNERKGRVVVDIRGLNAITQPDVYPVPRQAEIISAVLGCPYITVLDCASFFYQWRVHPKDRHKLTVVSHRGQESFNVAVMGYKNSPAYVQRQIDRLLRPHRGFSRAYVDDIVVYSKTLEEHLAHLRQIFTMLKTNNISIKPQKAFMGYPSVQLLGQKVDSFGLATSEEKLRAISKLRYPRNLQALETYLGLTGYMREYVPFYAGIAKPLQELKTELLRHGPVAGNARKSYSRRTRVENPTDRERLSFTTLQGLLAKPSYLVHPDPLRRLLVDLDASKEFGFGAMVYHVKPSAAWDGNGYPPRKAIEPILFLSRLLGDAETRYWPTELEIA